MSDAPGSSTYKHVKESYLRVSALMAATGFPTPFEPWLHTPSGRAHSLEYTDTQM